MNRIIFITLMLSVAYSQCDDYNQFQCNNDNNCEWLENIESVTCASLVSDEELCEAAPECTYSCDDGGGYFGWCDPACTGGMTYIDNGYCETTQIPECYQMSQQECNHPGYGSECEWVSDLEEESCASFNQSYCDDTSGCNWVSDIDSGWCGNLNNSSSCSSMGCSWSCTLFYIGNCYEYGCGGGSYYVNNSYCDGETEVNNGYCTEAYMLGDLDSNGYINVIDVVELVQIVLNSQYDSVGDMNDDGSTNVVDIVSLVDIILGGI